MKKKPVKSKKLAGAKGSLSALYFDPEDLVIVIEPSHPLYDERSALVPSEEFCSNLDAFGILEPVIVQKNTENGGVEVVAGRQRVLAARLVNKKRKKEGRPLLQVPVIPKRGLSAGDLMGIMVSENEHRADDDVMTKALKMQRFLNLGRSEEQAAVVWGVSVSSIKNMVGLLDASRPIQKALSERRIKASAAYKLSKLAPEEQKKRLAQIEGVKEKKRAKKVREIVDGRPLLRGKKEIEAALTMVENEENIREQDRQIAVWTMRWVLGEETLARFVGAARETGT
jgi:ParB family chromosome partitioning protein